MTACSLLFWIALAASAHAAIAVEEMREVANFTGIVVTDGIMVHVTTTANASADGNSTLVLSGTPEALSGVKSSVDAGGMLMLSRASGGSSLLVRVTAAVPGPLTYASATSGGNLIADAVSGNVTVLGQSNVQVEKLESSAPISIMASNESSMEISSGHVPFLSASCSASSSMALSGLQADSADIMVSAESHISGMAVRSADVKISSNSLLYMTAAGVVNLWCTESEVRISGDAAAVTEHLNTQCTVHLGSHERGPTAAAVASMPPPRRLAASTMFV
uniref:Putative auto-transporter adhesin head GIN domain-containing protein n=1 Tax=Alexandrium catenella TaxID=2925 RepID=A0A7S1WR64_ALECA|eukprot:CAMPEP_0171208130 /NCGR_PEP_ID=MMETSP0790-20130122/27932_1 /TAXON_ID=2925 /ORGANISM="Alexandrium catenella, Strain OF101" /LENGTH=276 /DNA_ID=CAMNT_0011673721 /DNA_START=70 /DNA_END=900 /DNA_ORIENTATION=+